MWSEGCLLAALLASSRLATFASALEKRLISSGDLPQYALDLAPVAYLYSGETYWPSSLSTHLEHVTPKRNSSSGTVDVPDSPSPLILSSMNT